MRKQTKKILSLVMSAAMALSLGAGVDMTKAEAADTYTAKFAYFASDWSTSEGTSADVKLEKGTAEYSVAINTAGDAGNVLNVDIEGFAKAAADANLTVTLTDISAKADGINAKIDLSKVQTGDIEEKGNYRIELFNQYGKTLNAPAIDKSLTWNDSFVVTFTLSITDASGETPSEDPVAPSEDPATPTEEPSAAPGGAPTADQLVGTAQLDSQANGWCGNEDCTNVKAEINGPGTYVVSSTWDEVQEDPQAYCAMTCADLKDIASYITFSDVTVWVDGKVVDIPVIYGGDKDCRIQLWNTWANDGVGAGCEVPENLPETFYEIKVQFTIGLRETPRDWDAEAQDATLINVDTTKENYEPEKKPGEIDTPAPSPAPVVKNTAKSVKAAKASVSVKKGKKATLTFKVTAVDNKKVVVDKVTATSSNKKAVKVVKVTKKAGKVVVSVKGVKKGSAKVTVKVGTKKATTKVKVK